MQTNVWRCSKFVNEREKSRIFMLRCVAIFIKWCFVSSNELLSKFDFFFLFKLQVIKCETAINYLQMMTIRERFLPKLLVGKVLRSCKKKSRT